MDVERLSAWWKALLEADLSEDEFRSQALETTVAFAREHVPYYRGAFSGLPAVHGIDDLRTYPVLKPSVLTRYYHPVLTEGVATDFVVFSGATTSVKYLHRSFAEYGPLYEFRDRFIPSGFGYSWDRRPPEFRLFIFDGLHGIRFIENRRGPLRVLYVPFTQMRHARAVRDVLGEFQREPKEGEITELWGSPAKLRMLTEIALEEKWAQGLTARRAFFGGFFVPSHDVRLIEEAWGAKAFPVYGLTEFHQSYAYTCPHCGWHHFERVVVPEFVALEDYERYVDTGPARLLLTHLVPTSLRQVLIRYDTGDVVELGDRCPATGHKQLRVLGRASQVLNVSLDSGTRHVLSPRMFVEAAASMPQLRTAPMDPLQFQPRFQHLGIPVMYWGLLDGDGERPTVVVQVESKDSVPSESYAAIRNELESRLLTSHERLRNLVEGGRAELRVSVHRPGELTTVLTGLGS